MARIFVSYSHENSALLDAFLKALAPVARRHGATVWHDRKMTSGVALDPHIAEELDGAEVFLALVSQTFLTSDYILEIELPAMRAAVEVRGALLIPVVVEPCSWKDDFGKILAVPLTHRGILKPIIEWTPRSKGFHEAAEQVGRALADFAAPLPSDELGPPPPIPEEEPGPKIGLVDGKFDLVTEPPPQAERTAPAQISLHGRLRDRLDRLGSDMQRVENSHRGLCREFDDYRRFVASDLADLDVAALLSAGNGLAAMVAVLEGHDPAISGTMTEALEPEIVGGLKALLSDHALFVMGFEEGRELTARLAQNRLYGEDLRDVRNRTEAVLAEFVRRPALFGGKAKSLITASLRALREGAWDARDLVEIGAGLAVNSVVGIGRELTPKLMNAATPVAAVGGAAWVLSTLAGDTNMEAIRAALALFTEAARPLAAIAVSQDIHRFVSWIGDAARKVAGLESEEPIIQVNRSTNNPDTRPADFDINLIHEMIIGGKRPPDSWANLVKSLDFSQEFQLKDASLLRLFRNLEHLNLSRTSISDLSPLSNLNGLVSLNVSQTPVSDMSPLRSLYSLQSLNISNTNISEISAISNFGKLKSLSIWRTDIVDISSLASNLLLEDIDISFTSISDISFLIKNPNVRMLDIQNSAVRDLSVIEVLSNIIILHASDLKLLETVPRSWPGSLEQLSLYGSAWPRGQALPQVSWQIDPDGTVRRGAGRTPSPFKSWAASINR